MTAQTTSQAPATHGTPVTFDHVNKRFGRTQVLHDICLEVPGGQTTCIVGPSGSGKSTLLRCTNRLEEPDEGRVFLGDTDVTDGSADIDAVRARVGMVFQTFNLFPYRTALDNITLALRRVRKLPAEEAAERARAQLASVGLAGLEHRRPAQLSGGQQQRVAIARALAMEPEVMLFDEATSALDPELVKGVLSIMRDLAGQGMTMIVVTHEMRFAQEAAGQVVFLDHGRLIEKAAPDKFFGAPESPRLQAFLSAVT
ncbi:amino acid ABC transporter ATP-binding protein [Planotetraspora kaengkrachanensis]|uniref:Peptide ABC transporter ATP-binding protein n=1 Tax=Planotetraspora kaengkrachanensis TaxID=575193 RepID=A0A8J3M897_9ACTN|nr:amino acid ABC transporter ATP-binding protein [Planotetraspora kaengkrachanensis]GIG79530.1 peptide ABC transporter ATP-binding protein [Planotetraspora kaengkrachanensis]